MKTTILGFFCLMILQQPAFAQTAPGNSKIAVKSVPQQLAMVITLHPPKDTNSGPAILEALKKIKAYLTKRGKPPVSRPFARFINFDKEHLAIDIGWFVKVGVPSSDQIHLAVIPPANTATLVHTGPTGNELTVLRTLSDWAKSNHKTVAGNPWMVFKTKAAETPPGQTQAEYFLPIR